MIQRKEDGIMNVQEIASIVLALSHGLGFGITMMAVLEASNGMPFNSKILFLSLLLIPSGSFLVWSGNYINGPFLVVIGIFAFFVYLKNRELIKETQKVKYD